LSVVIDANGSKVHHILIASVLI